MWIELDGVKSRFFANISHEFRTPLTLIMGRSEKIKNHRDDVDFRNEASQVNGHARQLLSLVNQLLDLSKIEAGKMELALSNSDIVDFVKKAVASFESLATDKQINYAFHSELEKLVAPFDKDKLEKIIYNLLSNAFKFTPEGGKVAVGLRQVCRPAGISVTDCAFLEEQSGNCNCETAIHLTVSDSGIGIPLEKLPYIFNRFYQVDSSETRQYEGTGIGLALTQNLVEIHGSALEVESVVGKGTTFTVKLPFNPNPPRKGLGHPAQGSFP